MNYSKLLDIYHNILRILLNISVCIDIELIVARFGPKRLRWRFGPCESGNDDRKYQSTGKYKERCCLMSGEHVLSCYNSDDSLGWKHVQIRIDGHSYCDDFISYKAMRKILIEGR